MKKNVGYCCFTDVANIGDYALYNANKILFPELNILNANNPELDSNINIFGGGTLYPYSLYANKFKPRKFEFAIGQGVNPPLNEKFSIPTRFRMRYRKFNYFGVRGFHSQKILNDHGIKSIVTGDSALAFAGSVKANLNSNIIGINLVTQKMGDRIGNDDLIFNKVKGLINEALSNGHEILLIPCCISDVDGMKELCKISNKVRFLDFWSAPINMDLDAFFTEIATCSFVITERLHASVFCSLIGVPFLSINYKPKCMDFIDTLKLDRDISVDPDKFVRDIKYTDIVEFINNLSISEQLQDSTLNLRRSLWDAASEISDMIDNI